MSDIGGTPRSFYVDSGRLRERFNALDYYGQLLRGELTSQVTRESSAPVSAGQVPGTLTQRVLYRRGDEVVAVVHQYLRPDGSLGASGLPDPKWLRDGDIVLKVSHSWEELFVES